MTYMVEKHFGNSYQNQCKYGGLIVCKNQELDDTNGGQNQYSRCMINHPNPIFHDKTTDLNNFYDDYNSGKLARIILAINNQNVINMNILCP